MRPGEVHVINAPQPQLKKEVKQLEKVGAALTLPLSVTLGNHSRGSQGGFLFLESATIYLYHVIIIHNGLIVHHGLSSAL
jgi:hypothetical protein